MCQTLNGRFITSSNSLLLQRSKISAVNPGSPVSSGSLFGRASTPEAFERARSECAHVSGVAQWKQSSVIPSQMPAKWAGGGMHSLKSEVTLFPFLWRNVLGALRPPHAQPRAPDLCTRWRNKCENMELNVLRCQTWLKITGHVIILTTCLYLSNCSKDPLRFLSDQSINVKRLTTHGYHHKQHSGGFRTPTCRTDPWTDGDAIGTDYLDKYAK